VCPCALFAGTVTINFDDRELDCDNYLKPGYYINGTKCREILCQDKITDMSQNSLQHRELGGDLSNLTFFTQLQLLFILKALKLPGLLFLS